MSKIGKLLALVVVLGSVTGILTLGVSTVNASESPQPEIVGMDYPDSIELGEWATIKVSAYNWSSTEAPWQSINISFPENPGASNVEVLDHNLDSANKYPPGSEIGSGYGSGGSIVSDYTLVEGWNDPWVAKDRGFLKVRVKPQKAGDFDFYMKSVARGPSGAYYAEPAKDGSESQIEDQQDEYVMKRTITVVRPNPTLKVSLSASDTSLKLDESTTLKGTIKNTGDGDAGRFDILWQTYRNGDLVDERSEPLDGLAAGEKISVSKKVKFSEPGEYTLKLIANPEGDEGGPASDSVQITVERKISGKVQSCSVSPRDVNRGDSITATAEVKNTGEIRHEFYATFEFHGGGKQVDQGRWNSVYLDPSEIGEVPVDWGVPEDAPYDNYWIEIKLYKKLEDGTFQGWLDTYREQDVFTVGKEPPADPEPSVKELKLFCDEWDEDRIRVYAGAKIQNPYEDFTLSWTGTAKVRNTDTGESHEFFLSYGDMDPGEVRSDGGAKLKQKDEFVDAWEGKVIIEDSDDDVVYESGWRELETRFTPTHQLEVRVVNNDDDDLTLDHYIDGDLKKNDFGPVPSGKNWRIDIYELEEGSHVSKIVWKDPDTGKTRSDRIEINLTSDTYIEHEIAVSKKPDLAVTDITVGPGEPVGGEEATVGFVVKNQGEGPTPEGISFNAKLVIDGEFYEEITNSDLASGDSWTETFSPVKLSSGKHDIQVYVDSHNKIAETDEGNNSRTEEVNFASTHQLEVRVVNNDDDDQSADVYLDSNIIKSDFFVPSGSNYRVGFYNVEEGTHTVRVDWQDDDTGSSYSNSKIKSVQSDTFLTVPITEHERGKVDFKITNDDDEDYPYVYIYIDGDKKGYVSVPSGETRRSNDFEVSPGPHTLKIKVEEKDSGETLWYEDTVTVDSGGSGTGVFTIGRILELDLNISGHGAGFEVNPPGVSTEGEYSNSYGSGTSVSVKALAESGYEFDHWSGDASGTNSSVDVTMDSDKSLTAHFKPVSVIEATILDSSIESGEFVTGDGVGVSYTVKNTGNMGHEFYVGYSVIDKNDNWWPAPYESVVLDPGEEESVSLSWDVKESAPLGWYDARVAVWERESGGKLYGRLDKRDWSDAFEKVQPSVSSSSPSEETTLWTDKFPLSFTVKYQHTNGELLNLHIYNPRKDAGKSVDSVKVSGEGRKTFQFTKDQWRNYSEFAGQTGEFKYHFYLYDPVQDETVAKSDQRSWNLEGLEQKIRIEEFHLPEGRYKPGDVIELTFSVKKTSRDREVKLQPQLYLKGPGKFTRRVDGKAISINLNRGHDGSIEWEIPQEIRSGSYVPAIYLYNPVTNEYVDNRWPKSWTFTVDKGESYVEIEPTQGLIGKGRAVHVHFASQDLYVTNESAKVTNIEDVGFGSFLRLAPFAKAIVGGSVTNIPIWLESLSTAKSLVEIGQSLNLNNDGSMDFLFIEAAGGWGWAYMDRGLVDVGQFEIPTNIAKFPFPKDTPEHFYAELRYPIKNIADTILNGYKYVDGSPNQVKVIWTKSVEVGTFMAPIQIGNFKEGIISIHGDYGWNEDAILHEYGHWTMFSVYERFPKTSYGTDGVHSWSSKETSSTAFVEGWANFFASVVQKDKNYRNYNMESNWPNGPDIEGAVAGIFWDIYDERNEGTDILSKGFEPVWIVLREKNPENVQEFYHDWKDLGLVNAGEVKKIMNMHGVWPEESVATSAKISGSESEVETYDSSVEIEIKNVESDTPTKSGSIKATVDSKKEAGKAITFNVSQNTISYSSPEEVTVLFDREEVEMADGYEDALDPTNEENPEYLVILGSEGAQILVSIPKFSTHEIVITKQAEFRISELVIGDKEITSGECTTVSVDVTNIGGIEDNYVAKLFVDGEIVDTKQVPVKPGEKKIVPFEVSKSEPGTYQVKVGNHTSSFEVKPEKVLPWQTIGVIVLIVALVTIGIAVGRKK